MAERFVLRQVQGFAYRLSSTAAESDDAFRPRQGDLNHSHGIAGRIATITITGTFVRLYFTDPWSWATSRLWDMSKAEHAVDFVKIVVFLLGPTDEVVQQWKPDPVSFVTCRPASESGPSCVRKQEWVGEYVQEWALKRAFGKRSTVWSGITRPSYLDADKRVLKTDGQSTIVKAAYLPSGLVQHEYNMLTRLDPKAPRAKSMFYEIDEMTRAAILEDIPIPLGMIDLGPGGLRETRRLPEAAARAIDEAVPILAERLTHLELSVLAMHGPVGQKIAPYDLELDLIDLCEIFLGALGHGYYAATRNIHFRDYSEGNVLYRRLPNGKLRGFLVDYGNARHAHDRPDPVRQDRPDWVYLCLDDMRSGTDWFRCLAVCDMPVLLLRYTSREEELLRLAEGDPRHDRQKKLLAEAKMAVLRARHRYIDDLESFMYLLCYQASPSPMPAISVLN